MKRQWRAGRIILALLLCSLATLAIYLWPMQPRWQVSDERIVAFDLKQGLVYTIKQDEDNGNHELHGLDLMTGELRQRNILSSDLISSRTPWQWRFIMSEDCSKLVCFDSTAFIHILDAQKQCERICSIPGQYMQSLNISPDGMMIAFRENEYVEVWDVQTGKKQCRFRMPADAVRGTGNGEWKCSTEELQFSPNGRMLAVTGEIQSICVYDLQTQKLLGQTHEDCYPVFLNDNATLIALSGLHYSEKIAINKYSPLRKVDTFNQPATRLLETMSQRNHLGYMGHTDTSNMTSCSIHLLLCMWETSKRSLPNWIPESVRSKVETFLGWNKFPRVFPIVE